MRGVKRISLVCVALVATAGCNSQPQSEISTGSTPPESTQPAVSRGADADRNTEERIDLAEALFNAMSNVDPVSKAAFRGDVQTLRLLVEMGGDVNVEIAGGETPLHLAANRGMLEAAQFLIAQGARTDAVTTRQETPLHFAAERGHEEVVELLLEHGASIGPRNSDGKTPYQLAQEEGRSAVGSLLRARGAEHDPEDVIVDTSLHRAAAANDLQEIESLLAGGLDVAGTDQESKTPLHHAAEHGHAETVHLLLASRADVNARDTKGKTPLHYAADADSDDRRQLSTERGRASSLIIGLSPFDGHFRVLRMLVEAGADLDAQDRSGRSALDYAIEVGHEEAIEALRSAGAQSKPR